MIKWRQKIGDGCSRSYYSPHRIQNVSTATAKCSAYTAVLALPVCQLPRPPRLRCACRWSARLADQQPAPRCRSRGPSPAFHRIVPPHPESPPSVPRLHSFSVHAIFSELAVKSCIVCTWLSNSTIRHGAMPLRHQGIQHRTQPAHPGKLHNPPGRPPLNRDHIDTGWPPPLHPDAPPCSTPSSSTTKSFASSPYTASPAHSLLARESPPRSIDYGVFVPGRERWPVSSVNKNKTTKMDSSPPQAIRLAILVPALHPVHLLIRCARFWVIGCPAFLFALQKMIPRRQYSAPPAPQPHRIDRVRGWATAASSCRSILRRLRMLFRIGPAQVIGLMKISTPQTASSECPSPSNP